MQRVMSKHGVMECFLKMLDLVRSCIVIVGAPTPLQHYSGSNKHNIFMRTASCRESYRNQIRKVLELRVSIKTRRHGSGIIDWTMAKILE